jgi:hypothetical protein
MTNIFNIFLFCSLIEDLQVICKVYLKVKFNLICSTQVRSRLRTHPRNLAQGEISWASVNLSIVRIDEKVEFEKSGCLWQGFSTFAAL